MELALYRGISLVSKAIKFISRSPYSHAAFLFDLPASEAARRISYILPADAKHLNAGSVVEAWQKGGVRNTASLSDQHTAGTRVDIYRFSPCIEPWQEEKLLESAFAKLGEPYSWLNVLRFVTRKPGSEDGAWFCSELCSQCCTDAGIILFHQTEDWEVAPGLIPRSIRLRLDRSVITI